MPPPSQKREVQQYIPTKKSIFAPLKPKNTKPMIVEKSFTHILATLIAVMLCMPELLLAGTSQRTERMERYSAAEGLSSNMTHGMTEDSLGHIWVCTDYGLSRFDGSRFKRFEKGEYPSILRNDFFCATTQKDGSVLIGSYLGVALKYDANKDTFLYVAPKEFENTYYKQISGFCSNDKGDTYMWTSGGIYLYNKETGRFSSETPIYEMTKDTFICSMYVDPTNRIWVCTYWFQIGKRLCQGCIMSPCLFNFYAEYIMRNAELEEAEAGIKNQDCWEKYQ